MEPCWDRDDVSRSALDLGGRLSLGGSQSESALNGFVTICYKVSLEFNGGKSFVTKDYCRVCACTSFSRRDQIPVRKNEE